MLQMHFYAISRLTASVFFGTCRPSTRRNRMPTFREWLRANRSHRDTADQRDPWVTRSEKRPGDLVLGSGGKWSVVA
jgi:hypothetical protein